jgi:hypothetical protein
LPKQTLQESNHENSLLVLQTDVWGASQVHFLIEVDVSQFALLAFTETQLMDYASRVIQLARIVLVHQIQLA